MNERSLGSMVMAGLLLVASWVAPASAQEDPGTIGYGGSAPALDQLKAGLGAMTSGEFEEAYRHFERALDRASTSELRFQAHLGMGTAAASLDRFDQAEASYDQALKIKPDDSATLYSKGLLEKQRGRLNEAATLFARAAVRDPELGAAFFELGIVYAQLGRNEDSADACWRAVAVNPDDVEALLCLGVARYHLTRYAQARQAFEAALEIQPDNARAVYGFGLTLLYQEDPDGAMQQHAILQELDQGLADSLFELITQRQ